MLRDSIAWLGHDTFRSQGILNSGPLSRFGESLRGCNEGVADRAQKLTCERRRKKECARIHLVNVFRLMSCRARAPLGLRSVAGCWGTLVTYPMWLRCYPSLRRKFWQLSLQGPAISPISPKKRPITPRYFSTHLSCKYLLSAFHTQVYFLSMYTTQ